MQCSKKCAISWASQPKCPSCHKAFTDDTLEKMFSKGFRRGELRKQVIANLQEQEMSLLPATAAVLAETSRVARWTSENSHIRLLANALVSSAHLHTFDLENALGEIRQGVLTLRTLGDDPRQSAKKAAPAVHKTVKCPGAGCLGFIPHSGPGAGFCGICDMRVCKECNKALPGPESVRAHTAEGCNADDLATWALIVKTSVMCPKCGTPIQKVDGCNQMWCTVSGCVTAFDWATGRIVNGPIHNPHYHEWLRQGGGLAAPTANVDCVGQPRDRFNDRSLVWVYRSLEEPNVRTVTHSSFENRKIFWTYLQWTRVLWETVGYHAVTHVDYSPASHEDLRIKYLNKEITKAQWATKLSHRETLRIKGNRLASLLLMFQTASMDLFNNLYDEIRVAQGAHRLPQQAPAMLKTYCDSMEGLRQYYVTQVLHVLSDYSDTVFRMIVWSRPRGYLADVDALQGPPDLLTDTDLQLNEDNRWLNWLKVPTRTGCPGVSHGGEDSVGDGLDGGVGPAAAGAVRHCSPIIH